jgi:hypothetical protein
LCLINACRKAIVHGKETVAIQYQIHHLGRTK